MAQDVYKIFRNGVLVRRAKTFDSAKTIGKRVKKHISDDVAIKKEGDDKGYYTID